MGKTYRDLTPDQRRRVSGARQARAELDRFEKEQAKKNSQDQDLARLDTGRSSRVSGGYGLPW